MYTICFLSEFTKFHFYAIFAAHNREEENKSSTNHSEGGGAKYVAYGAPVCFAADALTGYIVYIKKRKVLFSMFCFFFFGYIFF